jgi:hypothetical protein
MTLVAEEGRIFSIQWRTEIIKIQVPLGVHGWRNVLLLPNSSLLVYWVKHELFVMGLEYWALRDFATKMTEIGVTSLISPGAERN